MAKYIFLLLLEIILFCILFFNTFLLRSLNIYLLGTLLLFLIVLRTIIKYRKPLKHKYKDINFIIIGLSIILLGAMYLIGCFSGFKSSYSILSKTSIGLNKWLIIILTMILTEQVRYILSLKEERRQKKYKILEIIMFLNFILIDMLVAEKFYILDSYQQICEFFCLFLVQSISKNIFLNEISKKYGYSPCMCYRIIMDCYFYIIPIVPIINNFIKAVIMLVFPYILYITITKLTEKKKIKEQIKKRKTNYIGSTLLLIPIIVLVMLVSCAFQYGMLAVGSRSMTGTINKGDAIIYKKIKKEDQVKKNQVIVFKKNNVMIIHRVVDIFSLDDEKVYQTKGDANKEKDDWLVKQEEIVGVVNKKVLWIAWPSVLLNEIFN